MREMNYRAIGTVRSPFKEPKGTPIQPTAAEGIEGTIELLPEYADGLKDLDGFSHIVLIYHFHMAGEVKLLARPFMDTGERGIFAIRAPSRPNPIGLSVVRLRRIEGNILHIGDVDIIDGTPLLDIKPYVPQFDARDAEKIGWLEENVRKLRSSKDDGRFEK